MDNDRDGLIDRTPVVDGSTYRFTATISSRCSCYTGGGEATSITGTGSPCTASTDVVLDLSATPTFSWTVPCSIGGGPFMANFTVSPSGRVDIQARATGDTPTSYTEEEARICDGTLYEPLRTGDTSVSLTCPYSDDPGGYSCAGCRGNTQWQMVLVDTPEADPVDTAAAGTSCETEGGEAGVLTCLGDCALDTRVEGSCDHQWDCAETSFDDDDCALERIGTECEETDYILATSSWGYTGWVSWSGVRDCDGSCEYGDPGDADGTCSDRYDCIEFDWDRGDCIDGGEVCTLDDDTCGIYQCDGCCTEDTLGDGTCDEALDCAATGYDGGDCTR
jgi:hypothetical protein